MAVLGCLLASLVGMNLSAPAQSPAPEIPTLTVDNSDGSSAFTNPSGWFRATAGSGYWGADYVHDGNLSKGRGDCRFTPHFTVAGYYEVWIHYPSGPDRASNVPVDVVHATGTRTYTVNQRSNGGTWIKLGVHPFNRGSFGQVVIRTAGTDGVVCADAVRFVPAEPPVVTVVASDGLAAEAIERGRAWNHGTFTLTRTGPTELPLTVGFSLTGTASERYDFDPVGSTATFPAGSSTATVTIEPVDDPLPEYPSEMVSLNVLYGLGYTIGTPSRATVILDDNDWGPFLTVDNSDGVGRVVPVGGWSPSTSTSGYLGANYWHDQNTGKNTKWVAFYPHISEPGNYEVFIRHTASANRASNVPVDIVHAGGMKTVMVNQRINHGTWVSLGIYPFEVGSYGKVVVRTTGTDGYVIADSVRLVPIPRTVVTVSSSGANASEPSTPGYVVFTRTGDLRDPLEVFFYLSGSASPGADYQVPKESIVIPAGAASTRLTLTPKDDLLPESVEQIYVDLRRSSAYLTGIEDHASLYLYDDDPRAYLKVDNTDGPLRVMTTPGWVSSSYTAGFVGADYLHDGNSGKGTKSVEFVPTVPFTDVYNVYIHYPAAANRASNVPVEIRHANGSSTVRVNQRINGGMWFKLGTFTLAGGISSRVIIRNTGTDGYVMVDAVLLDRPLEFGLASPRAAPIPLGLSVDRAEGVVVTFDGEPGVEYVLESSANLVEWLRIASGVGTGPGSRLLDREGGGAGHRFYRTLRVEPLPDTGLSDETAGK